MKKVMISIISKQIMDDDENAMELISEGEYEYSPEESRLSYLESSITGMEGTKTTFNISPVSVTLKREGTVTSDMLFEEGKRHISLYGTPYGVTTMQIFTRFLNMDIGENGGKMRIGYELSVENMKISDNEFIIEFRQD